FGIEGLAVGRHRGCSVGEGQSQMLARRHVGGPADQAILGAGDEGVAARQGGLVAQRFKELGRGSQRLAQIGQVAPPSEAQALAYVPYALALASGLLLE